MPGRRADLKGKGKRLHTGRALCIGVDTSEGPSARAGADACALAGVARQQGFESVAVLLGAAATRAEVFAQLLEGAARSAPGDLFMITFSGHGGRKCLNTSVPGRTELRGAWVLSDGSLTDDEMYCALAAFRVGVRVLVISDSCHGGVPTKRDDYSDPLVSASVLVLSACGPDQYADAAGLPGHFTTAVLDTWAARGAVGSYRTFFETVAARMPAYQQPQYFWIGRPDPRYEAQAPFTI